MTTISMVIGSWGSYNACNDRALGSKWIDLKDYRTWSDIAKELKKEGFDLHGIDEELFIQDYEADFELNNTDYMNPKTFFETIRQSGILDDEWNYKMACALMEENGYSDFKERVDKRGKDWGWDLNLYEETDVAAWAQELYEECYDENAIKELGNLYNYIDWERYGRDIIISDSYYETSYGILYIGS